MDDRPLYQNRPTLANRVLANLVLAWPIWAKTGGAPKGRGPKISSFFFPRAQTRTLDGPGIQKHHQNSTRRPPREERTKMEAGEEKKWFFGRSGGGAARTHRHTQTHTDTHTHHIGQRVGQRIGQKWIGKIALAKWAAKKGLAKIGLAKVGHNASIVTSAASTQMFKPKPSFPTP